MRRLNLHPNYTASNISLYIETRNSTKKKRGGRQALKIYEKAHEMSYNLFR